MGGLHIDHKSGGIYQRVCASLVISTASIKYMSQKRWLQQATSLPRIEIRQRVVKKKNEKGKESGGVEATSKKTILKVISCQFNEIANSYGIIKRCFYCDET